MAGFEAAVDLHAVKDAFYSPPACVPHPCHSGAARLVPSQTDPRPCRSAPDVEGSRALGVAKRRHVAGQGRMKFVTIGEELLEERRRWRRAGDPRLSEADRELLRRVTRGDLADAFQEALDADLDADPLLGGHPTDNDDG